MEGDKQLATACQSDTHRRPLPATSGGGRAVRGHRTIARRRGAHPVCGASESDAGRIFHEFGGGGPRAGIGGGGERGKKRAGGGGWNTFREAGRDPLLYNLVFFALLMLGGAGAGGHIFSAILQTV